MSEFKLVDPKGWTYDLHSVYSAYLGYFQVHNIPWFERTWGHLFTSFEEFLAFSWPVITVTDAHTGRAHIVTRLNSIGAFLKMIKTRFGETLPQAPNILQVTPFESSTRHLRNISDYASYKKLYSTLPAAVFAAQRTRVRTGDARTIKGLWANRDKSYLVLSFVWSERNEKSCLEFGYAAVRCGHMEASGHWPPTPDSNYRKGHYIVEEYVDKVFNKHPPNHPWQYAFGESQLTPKNKLPQIVQAVISSLKSPESETNSNDIVLVGIGMHALLGRLEEMKIKIPHNVLMIDIANFEKSLYTIGERGVMIDPKTEKPRSQGSTLSLDSLLRSFQQPSNRPQQQQRPNLKSNPKSNNSSSSGSSPLSSPHAPLQTSNGVNSTNPGSHLPFPLQPVVIPQCTLANAGNEAFMALFALQMLLDPVSTRPPTKKAKMPVPLSMANLNAMNGGIPMMGGMNMMNMGSPAMVSSGMPGMPQMSMSMYHRMGPPNPMPMSGIPGMPPTVGVNGLMGPMPLSMNTTGSNNSGRERRQSSFSPYDLSGEFGEMQLSVKRARSSAPVLPGGEGFDSPSSGQDRGRDEHPAVGKNQTVSTARPSFLSVEQQRLRRHSDYALR
ncbi:hypothetical protein Agabi119p4_1113 [Agaricus bisporus var. burnettii]|uniref:Gfd2/YDR514C-like C-terminal domain-containing protein n=1 Tax=Agaricus bisporus var. burnettii TaxID=192524 RepID=A0A8H7FBS4_AGABI|nr:hypothetical protein Agabi119p4_1113 [Agaricus bisporus var. burnettii]